MVGRLLAHTHSRSAVFGGDDLTDADLPPPSTLAAQLVRNHVETARGVRQPDTTVPFRQLLQELLNKTSVPETDVEVNHKLIKVVVEAGLDVLFQDNPFPQWGFLLPQAVDSLAVIQSTIQRQPEILFQGGPQPNLEQHPHLLLWLFPKLLMISKHSKGDQLQASLASLLSSLVLALSKTLDLWPHAKAVLHMLRDCVTDVFLLLQDNRIFSKSSPQVPGVLLPPARSTSNAWPATEDESALLLGHQIITNDALSAIRIQLLLVSTLRDIASTRAALSQFQTSTVPLHKWLFDSVGCLSRILFQHKSWLDQHSFFSLFALQIMRLHNICLNGSFDASPRSRISYLLGNLCEFCSKLIVYEGKSPLDNELQRELASTLELLVDRLNSDYAYIIEEFLLPSIRVFALDTSKFETTTESLRQVLEKYLSRHDTKGQVFGQNGSADQADTVMRDDAPLPSNEATFSQPAPSSSSLRVGLVSASKPDHMSNGQSEDLYQTLKRRVAILLGRESDTTPGGQKHDAV